MKYKPDLYIPSSLKHAMQLSSVMQCTLEHGKTSQNHWRVLKPNAKNNVPGSSSDCACLCWDEMSVHVIWFSGQMRKV
jgi:hypothetical protein